VSAKVLKSNVLYSVEIGIIDVNENFDKKIDFSAHGEFMFRGVN